MTEVSILATAVMAVAAMIGALKRPGGCLRYSFLCGALYLAWIVPQLVGLSAGEFLTPENGFLWLSIMVVLCLGASLVGWRIGTRQERSLVSLPPIRDDDNIAQLFWPVVGLTAFMFLLHAMIGLQPLEDLARTQWSGPLTIIVFFLSLSAISLYLSLRIALRKRSPGALLLAGANIMLSGTSAFIAMRRGEIIDFGVAATAVLWFGARRRVPVALLATAVVGMIVVTYAIGPLRSAANAVQARAGTSVGLLSPEVWAQVDFAEELRNSSRQAVDLSNAAHLIDYTNRWGDFSYGQRSWDRLVFQWVPAQILGADFKNSLMFRQGSEYEQLETAYGYVAVGGTTTTGFGFAYQEFGPFGFVYFLIIGIVMGRLWSRAETGDLWAQALYVSFAGYALLSVTHHAMWLIVQIPLFLLAVFVLKRMTRNNFHRRRPIGAYNNITR